MGIKLSFEDIYRVMSITSPDFPKYTTQLLNIANRNSQATRPKYVGQLSELINKYQGQSYEEWTKWYLENYPDAIETAASRIWDMILKLKNAMSQITKGMIKEWVEDLILTKTYIGMGVQKYIIKLIADREKLSYRSASPSEESKGIDGFIGKKSVSVKPITYKTKDALQEKIEADIIIYYEKTKDAISIEYEGTFS